jgi:hypothetical protein
LIRIIFRGSPLSGVGTWLSSRVKIKYGDENSYITGFILKRRPPFGGFIKKLHLQADGVLLNL